MTGQDISFHGRHCLVHALACPLIKKSANQGQGQAKEK
jgi:hypothetical protein